MNTLNNKVYTEKPAEHLQKDLWLKVNRHLIKKAICEFNHEKMIRPELIENYKGWNVYLLRTEKKDIHYKFHARPMALNHLWIDSFSIQKLNKNIPETLDAILFIQELKGSLNIPEEVYPAYLEEIICTLNAYAFKYAKGGPSAMELASATFQEIEQAMIEGHPGFIANSGKIGFDSKDYINYSPEAGSPFQLIWLAGHKDRTFYAGTESLSFETLIQEELGSGTIENFNKIISSHGHDPCDYIYIPVHPWQWFNKIANTFAPEIASGKLLCLGYGPDEYLAQQSIRTLFNCTHPLKRYVKTSLSITNMGFVRGLPIYYLGAAPEMAEWLNDLLANDPFIEETGFKMLNEVATVCYVNPYYEPLGKHHSSNRMLASLWRESPAQFITPQQRILTMASLLHVDQNGKALLPEIISASGVPVNIWLHHYLKAYLMPILHCFYHYDLVFMPHGENVIVVLENNLPVKIFLKDITEEATILNPHIQLPQNLARMYAEVPDNLKLLSVFIDVFDGFFRFLSQILLEHMQFPEENFWKSVAESILNYQEQQPQLKAKFACYDLFTPDFTLSCLNRLQLKNNKSMVSPDDPVSPLQFKGKLKNPIAAFKIQN